MDEECVGMENVPFPLFDVETLSQDADDGIGIVLHI